MQFGLINGCYCFRCFKSWSSMMSLSRVDVIETQLHSVFSVVQNQHHRQRTRQRDTYDSLRTTCLALIRHYHGNTICGCCDGISIIQNTIMKNTMKRLKRFYAKSSYYIPYSMDGKNIHAVIPARDISLVSTFHLGVRSKTIQRTRDRDKLQVLWVEFCHKRDIWYLLT